MRSFDDILDIAAERKGGRAAVLEGAPVPLDAKALAATADSDWLATMARAIFQTGISWTVVDNKWPGILEAFDGFDVGKVSMMEDDRFDALLTDTRVIRSGPKLTAIRDNAVFIREVAAGHGSFGRRIADWPASDFAGLTLWLKENGARLGGNTGPYVLRQMGRDGWILSRDVTARLVAEGVIDKPATSRKALAAVQAAFDTWHAQSGLPFSTISRVLAQSIGNAPPP